jgi:hypothetical protein
MQQSVPWFLVPGIVVAFAVVFTTIWTGVCALLATTSGWRSMAERYPCPEGLAGAPLASGYAVRVGLTSYRGVLSFEATPQGLVARVMRLFPFHRALLVPWGSIAMERGGGFLSAGTMRVAGGSDFSLNQDAYASIERARSAGGAAFAANV